MQIVVMHILKWDAQAHTALVFVILMKVNKDLRTAV